MTLEELQKENEALRQQVKELTEELKKLRKEIEEWKRGFRNRPRRFSSRPEGQPQKEAKKPGRKGGHAKAHRSIPNEVDRTIEHPVPSQCACGGSVEPIGTSEEVIVEDIPPVKIARTRHVAHEGRCRNCGAVRRATLPGAPDAGTPIAGVVLGERALELAVSLRMEHHLPLRHISGLFGSFFGMRVSHGAINHAILRTSRRVESARQEIRTHVRDAAVVGSDETSFRQNGDTHWVWLLRTPSASLFHLARHRDAATFDALLPRGFTGVLVSDCYAVYTRRLDLIHAYCGAHVLCEAKKIAELEPCPSANEFVYALRWLYRKAEEVRESGDLDALDRMRNRFHFLATNARYHGNPDIERLQARLKKYESGFTSFLGRNDIPWNNNASERDLRPLCLHRKVSRQTRSERGAHALGTWMSITQTLRKNHLPFGPWFALATKNLRAGLPPPSVFTPQAS